MCIRDSFGGMAQEDYFAGVVTLREDPGQFLVREHQQGANTVLSHLPVSYTHLDVYKRQVEESLTYFDATPKGIVAE